MSYKTTLKERNRHYMVTFKVLVIYLPLWEIDPGMTSGKFNQYDQQNPYCWKKEDTV